jgi:hypothetical protein
MGSVPLLHNANGKRCFGATYGNDMSAEMGDNGYVITTHWQNHTFLIKSCEITDQEDKTTQYFRMPKWSPKFTGRFVPFGK